MAFELEEEWAPIKGYPNYIISTYGQILNVRHERELKGRLNTYGFLKVALYHEGSSRYFYVHHLVALTFLSGYSEGVHVRFKDGDKTNCRLDNLKFGNGRGVGQFKQDSDGSVRTRKFRVVETGDVFRNVETLAEFLQTDKSSIYKYLRGERGSVKGYDIEVVYL